MMKNYIRIICVLLVLGFIAQTMTGCAKKTDDTIYLSKGEFFAYFVHETNMTSQNHSAEEIQNCEDGSVEADIIVEWGYLPEKQSKNGLKKSVDKETVVTVVANATSDLKTGDPSKIKDADLLENPQLIADAYASGFFELENGYFDGATKMTFAACEEIMDKANEYIANVHYESNDSIEMVDGVIVDDGSDYSDGDIVIDIVGEPSVKAPTESKAIGLSANEKAARISLLSSSDSDTPRAATLESKSKDAAAVNKLYNSDSLRFDFDDFNNVEGFYAQITKARFEGKLKNPKIGDTIVFKEFDLTLYNSSVRSNKDVIIGTLQSVEKNGLTYNCYFRYPTFEEAAEKIPENKKDNASGIDPSTFKQILSEYMGWKFSFDKNSSAITVTAKKDFTDAETGRKQEWQNARKTVTAEASFTVGNFNIDVDNLKSFATKKGSGSIKLTCDTTMGFSLSQSLRYVPDSNRNGKFPSNWNNSRWTDSDAPGAKEIKVASFKMSYAGIIGGEIGIYLKISVDGQISFGTSIKGGGILIKTNNGNISSDDLGDKTTVAKINTHLEAKIYTGVTLQLFTFINVIHYTVGAKLIIDALVDLYYDEELRQADVFADKEGLNEFQLADSKFYYCIGVDARLLLFGELEGGVVKEILDALSWGKSLNFEKEIARFGFHYEDGHEVGQCTRGNKKENEEVKASKDDDITLDAYKLILNEGESGVVYLRSLPSQTMDLLNTKNSITVKSDNKQIAEVSYNKSSKAIVVSAVGEGSTEIVITAKRGILWWKKTCEQKVSVTVNANHTVNTTSTDDFDSENAVITLFIIPATYRV